ncbi:hypothetical protein MTER_21690 [Mycolicibacter terrae]|uniref:Uncharacterized protein n=1 Tax=Mycolicibacter terrae TaxID=1788 RepID=A0AAD1HXZ8_9MYCO|nr:hypothetical protein MTER_21690 [Mycolicibacter terrae]
MTVSYGWRGVAIQAPIGVSGAPRSVGGVVRACGIAAPVARRRCDIEGYLQRKLHRQWRNRGS